MAAEQGLQSRLEVRLMRLEAHEAIRKCIYTYALAGDRSNDPAIVADLFTTDASYEAAGMGRFEGLDAIVKGLDEIACTVVLWAFHAPGGPLIDLAADMKSAHAFWWVWCPVNLRNENAQASPHWGAGHYNADLVEQNGIWKFTRVLFETKLRTPYGGPWTEIEGPFEWPRVR